MIEPAREAEALPAHHPPDESLVEHAAGAEREAVALAVACHVAMCPGCARRLAALEAVGGGLLLASPGAELPAGALDSVLARLDGPPRAMGDDRALGAPPPSPPPFLAPYRLPRPLRAFWGGSAETANRWRFVVPGVRAIDLPVAPGDARARLVAFKGGITIPLHDHGGPEHIVVFTGALEERDGRFARGDISIRTAGETHQQRVAPGEPCVALVVNEGKIKPLTLRGRLLLALARD